MKISTIINASVSAEIQKETQKKSTNERHICLIVILLQITVDHIVSQIMIGNELLQLNIMFYHV